MLVDSHCHLNFPQFADCLPEVFDLMQTHQVTHALVVGVNRPHCAEVLHLAETYNALYATVGVHPDNPDAEEYSQAELIELAIHPKVVGIGETGLDYYRCTGELGWQHERFRTHIRAAKYMDLPLIIHTRESALDVLRIMREEQADKGVMHCFTENWDIARAALDLGFYISFSGVVTFKNAKQVKEVACKVPLDRMLVETDSPFLAPVPYRGQLNQPGYVRYVAECIAGLRGITLQEVATATTDNFFELFRKINRE